MKGILGGRKGNRGRGATEKKIVFGLYKRNGYVHTLNISNTKEFVRESNYTHGIENFFNQAKGHLGKYNGIPKQHCDVYLKNVSFGVIIALLNKCTKLYIIELKRLV